VLSVVPNNSQPTKLVEACGGHLLKVCYFRKPEVATGNYPSSRRLTQPSKLLFAPYAYVLPIFV